MDELDGFKVGDHVLGTKADIEGCEGVIETIAGRAIFIRITKLGTKSWHGKSDTDLRIGNLSDRNWRGCIKLISQPEPEPMLGVFNWLSK